MANLNFLTIAGLLVSWTSLALGLNDVLDLNGTFPYLIDSKTGKVIQPRDYMDFENIYAPNETYKLKQTAQGRNYHLIKAFDFANYYQSDYWHYSDEQDLIQSAQPVADPQKCSDQLDWLEAQINSTSEVLFRPGQQHINLMTVIDSFGHPETATYFGHGYWLGSYHQCMKVSVNRRRFEYEECVRAKGGTSQCGITESHSHNDDDDEYNLSIKFRYCVGKAHEIDWPTPDQDNYVPRISYKVGLCIPETCETLSFRSHSQQLERLMRFNFPDYLKNRINLHDLYCLPDNRSPIRRLSTSGRIFLSLVALWLGLITFSTFIYSCYKRHQKDIKEILTAASIQQQQSAAGNHVHSSNSSALKISAHSTNLNDKEPKYDLGMHQFKGPIDGPTMEQNKINSAKLLLQINHQQVRSDLSDGGNEEKTASCSVINPEQMYSSSRQPQVNGLNNNCRTKTANISSNMNLSTASYSSSVLSAWLAESPKAIKIIQALSIKETTREFRQPPKMLQAPDAVYRLRVNLNALDFIKCMCCILVIFGHIIFIHMQHLSNIIHTIELSHEFYPRALIAFFNFVDTFFIISGMLTAYFVFKRFDRRSFSNPMVWISISLMRLLRLSPVYVLVFWFIKTLSIYMTDGPIWDYGTDKNSIRGLCMNDHWWKSILYFGNVGTMQPLCILPAWSIIVDSQYSLVVPWILFVIFKNKRIGYLFLLLATIVSTTKMSLQLASQTAVKNSDMAKIRLHVYPLISRFAAEFYNTAWNRIGPVAIGIFGGHMLYQYEVGHIAQWPRFMRGICFKLVLSLHVLIFLLPVIGRLLDDPAQSGEVDMTIFILSNASIKPIWSVINTILVLRLITDLRSHSVLARLMSHNIWHCLGKLCFTSYLIHYEIILTLLKSRQEGLVDTNWWNAVREFSAVFFISTIISYFIYILYEAPMNRLITLAFARHREALRNKTSANELEPTVTVQSGPISPASLSPNNCDAATGTTKPILEQAEQLLRSPHLQARVVNNGNRKRNLASDSKDPQKGTVIVNSHNYATSSIVDRQVVSDMRYTRIDQCKAYDQPEKRLDKAGAAINCD